MLTIEQLAREAGFMGEALDNTQFGTTHLRALENFAELIVQECVKQVETFDHTANPCREMVPVIIDTVIDHFKI
jgi:hypothetical protein